MHQEDNLVEVETDEIDWASAPEVIEAAGLGPCIGIIIYDTQKKIAVVGHFHSPSYGDRVEDLLSEGRSLSMKKELSKIYIGGGLIDSPEDEESIMEERNYVKNSLLRNGYKEQQMDIRYQKSLPRGESYLDLRIYTETGEVQWRTYLKAKLKNKISTLEKK